MLINIDYLFVYVSAHPGMDMHSNIHNRKKAKIVKKVINKHLKERIPVKEAPNTCFDKNEILNPLFGAISSRDFIESYVEDLRENRYNIPSGDTIFYRLKDTKLSDVKNCFYSTNEEILREIEKIGLLDRPIDRGIDCHDTGWFGKNEKHTYGTKQIRGTNYAHRYMSIESLTENLRLTFHALPMNQFTSKSECLKELLITTKKWLKKGGINHLDRGFFDVEAISVFQELNEDFIIAAKRNIKIDRIEREVKGQSEIVPRQYIPNKLRRKRATYSYHVEPYTMKKGKRSVTFNLVFVFVQYEEPQKKDETFIFATNLKVDCKNVLLLSEGYRKRWGIETGYRVKKEVKGKTCSPNYVIRVLFQMLSILLYNLWVLCNILLSGIIFVKKGYPISMCKFRKILCKITTNNIS
jgi:hypothetical protein